jgi:branched-subunit amino acid transport protein AzlD
VPEPGYVAAVVALSAAVTWTLRAAPFAVLASMRDSAVVATLRRRMPLGVLVILAAHTLRNVPTGSVLAALPYLVAVAVTVGLHLWRRHMLLSIAAGTAVHVALATLLATT